MVSGCGLRIQVYPMRFNCARAKTPKARGLHSKSRNTQNGIPDGILDSIAERSEIFLPGWEPKRLRMPYIYDISRDPRPTKHNINRIYHKAQPYYRRRRRRQQAAPFGGVIGLYETRILIGQSCHFFYLYFVLPFCVSFAECFSYAAARLLLVMHRLEQRSMMFKVVVICCLFGCLYMYLILGKFKHIYSICLYMVRWVC